MPLRLQYRSRCCSSSKRSTGANIRTWRCPLTPGNRRSTMNESQLLLFPGLADLPIFDENDARSHKFLPAEGRNIRECSLMEDVQECLRNPQLVPLGAVRFGVDGKKAVVVYFGERG